MACTFTTTAVPGELSVAVWDKNSFYKDVFCGSVTIPCTRDMPHLTDRDFVITKKGKRTGLVRLTVTHTGAVADDHSLNHAHGCEVDNVVAWSRDLNARSTSSMQFSEHHSLKIAQGGDHHDELVEVEDKGPAPPVHADAPGHVAAAAHALLGSWSCTGTWGLEDFLKASGVTAFQRKIAAAMKWPSWEYVMEGGHPLFLNHSAIGLLRESIPLGQDYEWKDGKGNLMTCRAEWEDTPTGGVLRTSREGAIGKYKEERKVSASQLDFTLTNEHGLAWGRSFSRD